MGSTPPAPLGNLDSHSPANDLFERYGPPFDLLSDMLFVAGTAAARPLRTSFPDVPLLEVAGRVPFVLWFSRVRRLCYSVAGGRECLGAAEGFGYYELNVVLICRRRRIFVPGIYATDGLTQRIGRRYGMPKSLVPISFEEDGARVQSAVRHGGSTSRVSARLLSSGRLFAKPFDLAAPWWSWPAEFPAGSSIRARIGRVPRLQLAWLTGVLALDEPWLPQPTRLCQLGAYVPGLEMRLPAPWD